LEAEYFLGVLRLGREQDDGRPHAGAAQLATHLETVPPRQHDVEEDQIPRRLASTPGCRLTVGDHLCLVAFRRQIVAQSQRDVRFVFDDQDARHGSSSGSCTVKVLPAPGSLSTRTAPPCPATMWCTIAR